MNAPRVIARQSGATRENATRVVPKLQIGKVTIGAMCKVVLIVLVIPIQLLLARKKSGVNARLVIARQSGATRAKSMKAALRRLIGLATIGAMFKVVRIAPVIPILLLLARKKSGMNVPLAVVRQGGATRVNATRNAPRLQIGQAILGATFREDQIATAT